MQKCEVKILQKVIEGFLFLKSFGTKICVWVCVCVLCVCVCVLCVCVFCHVQLFATPWTVARQAPLSMGIFRQELWRDCHFLLQGIFLIQGLKVFLAVAGKYFTPSHLGSWA